MDTFEELYGKTNLVAKIAERHGMPVQLAMFVMDYLLHGRKVPFYSRPDVDMRKYGFMVSDLQAYCTEFNKKYRGDNYAPNGPPIVTPEGYYP
jgi:hypothetical protein